MANTYTWSWPALDTVFGPDGDGDENIVTVVHYGYTVADAEETSAQTIGTVGLEKGEDDFIELEDIDEATLTGWVEGALGEERVAELKLELDNRLAEKVTPTQSTVRTMPWDDS